MEKLSEILQITSSKWQQYKRLRLFSLKSDPLSFARDPGEEDSLPAKHWKGVLSRKLIFGQFNNNQLIGFVGLSARIGNRLQHIVDITGLYVHPDFRRRGIAQSLMLTAIEAANLFAGARTLSLMVNTSKLGAINLYHRMGFTVVAKIPGELCIDGQLYDEYMMQRKILPE